MSAAVAVESSPTLSRPVIKTALDFRAKLPRIHILSPRPWEIPDIPPWANKILGQIQGFMSPTAATDDVNHGLTSEEHGIYCIPLLSMVNLGLTKKSTQHVTDFADAIAQKHGERIYLQGNSLGGFFAHLIAFAHPEIVEGMFLTASPHQLTMDSDDLKEHTNIALFLGWMTTRGLNVLCDQTLIQNWATYRKDPTSEIAKEMEAVFAGIAKAYYAATHDRTVKGEACLATTPNGIEHFSHNARSFAVWGDHGDVARGAVDSMRHLILNGMDADLPPDIAAGLAPTSEITDLIHVTPRAIIADYASANIPQFLEELRTSRSATRVRSAINAPSVLMSRVRSTQVPPSLDSSEGTLALEPQGLVMSGN